MEINAFEEKLNVLIDKFIQKNRMKMFLGSARMHEPIRLYLFNTLKLHDNYSLLGSDTHIDYYLNFKVPKMLSIYEECCGRTILLESGSHPIAYAHPWKFILEDYAHSALAYVDKQSDILPILAILNDINGFKILFSSKDISIDDNTILTDDIVFFHLDVTRHIYINNPYLRKCFVNIFSFANSLLWFLHFLRPNFVCIKSINNIEEAILYSITTSLSIPVKIINNG